MLDGLSSSSPDVAHSDGHPGYTRLTRIIMLLELHSKEGVQGLNGCKPDMKLQVVSGLFVDTNRTDKDDKLFRL